jgi:molybdenum cofactor cytidylyltransferase
MAFVGAGGKTTAIFRAARELLTTTNHEQATLTVLITTTTHFGAWQSAYADHFFRISSALDIIQLEKKLPVGVVLLTGDERNNRLAGLPPRLLDKAQALAENHDLPLLIEADGSHTLPLKAPAVHEPVIPDFIETVVVVAGLMGLGMPLTKNWVHRPEKFAYLSDLHIGEIVTGNALAKVLLNKDGGLKNIPPHANRIILLNQADTPTLQSSAKKMSGLLIPKYHSVVIASLSGKDIGLPSNEIFRQEQAKGIHAVIEKIGGIILAAGGSSRFGESKQLLIWKGIPLIRHVAITALRAGLSPVIVVVGSSSREVEAIISDLPVRIVNNDKWAIGISSSIKKGISAFADEVGGAVFLQADQPHIPPELIQALVEKHETTLNPIIAPQIDGQRGNPVLFDSCTFTKLLSLEGDIGGRALFGKYQVQWIPWQDSHLLMDIDSPEDYRKFLQIYPDGEG